MPGSASTWSSMSGTCRKGARIGPIRAPTARLTAQAGSFLRSLFTRRTVPLLARITTDSVVMRPVL
jgi:hypothetical protein